jgi:hypothetical protein
MNKNEETESL